MFFLLNSCFLVDLKRPVQIQVNQRTCLHFLIVPSFPLSSSVHFRSLFQLHGAREQHVPCCNFNLRSEQGAGQWHVSSWAFKASSSGKTFRRATPFAGCQYSKFQIACPPAVALSVWRHGPTSCSTVLTGRKPARFFQVAAGAESSDYEFGILEDERCLKYGGVCFFVNAAGFP